jgi:hypothetical protein
MTAQCAAAVFVQSAQPVRWHHQNQGMTNTAPGFLHLCLMCRWQEQGVLAFVWLLFVARDQLWVLDMPGDLSWDHDKHPDKPRHWCKEAPAAVQ